MGDRRTRTATGGCSSKARLPVPIHLQKLTAGLSRTWTGFLRDWDRSLRAGNYPQTTRYNYLLAATQLGRYLGDCSPDPDADDAAGDPCAVTRAHVESFQAWMIETRSASTALNKHKGLQQLFKWLVVDEQAIDRSPMERVRQPKTPRRPIPVMRDEDTGKLLDACKGKGFANLRDEALIRVYTNTGARLFWRGTRYRSDRFRTVAEWYRCLRTARRRPPSRTILVLHAAEDAHPR